jgi:hypothetical protein
MPATTAGRKTCRCVCNWSSSPRRKARPASRDCQCAVDSQTTSSHPDHPDPNPVLSLLQIPVRSNSFQVALPHAAGVANNNKKMGRGGCGGFPPTVACSDQRHCGESSTSADNISSEVLSTQLRHDHMSSDSTHRLTAQSLRLCHQQGVPLTCLRGILPQQYMHMHDSIILAHAHVRAAGVSGDPS